MPPAVIYKRFETREALWMEGGTDSSLSTKTTVEKVLEERGEFPVVVLQIVDVEAAEIEEFNAQSPIAEEMLAAEQEQ